MKQAGIVILTLLLTLGWCDRANAQEGSGLEAALGQAGGGAQLEQELAQIQQFLDEQNQAEELPRLSVTELMGALLSGNLTGVAEQIGRGLKTSLTGEIRSGGKMLAQAAAIGMVGALFANFAAVFKGAQIANTSFFITYLLLFTCLITSFLPSIAVASQALEQILQFMRVLLPAYFLSVAFAGGSASAVALHESMLAGITAVQWLCLNVLVPLVRIQVLLVLIGNMTKEEMLSHFTELLEQGTGWILKTMMGLVLGFHVIQSMVLPYADSAGKGTLSRLAGLIPGLGTGAETAAQVVLGAGVLIKNTMGAAAVVILFVLALIPLLKLTVLMALYRLAAAAMQPVCDKRMVACVNGVAAGHRMLLKIAAASLILFSVTIALTCAATNATYYAI